MDPRDVKIPSPCSADWAGMHPDEAGKSRHCDHCEMRVHDLSAMTEREARVFLAATADHRVCLSYLETSGGERLFADTRRAPATGQAAADVVPLARLTDRGRRPGVAAPLVKTAFMGALAACTAHGQVEPLEIEDAETEAALLQTAPLELDGTTIPDAKRVAQANPDSVAETPCDTEPEPDPRPGTKRPPKTIHRTAGIPIRTTGDPVANDPLSGL